MKSIINKHSIRVIGLIIFALILWRLDIKKIFKQFLLVQLDIFILAILILVLFHLIKAVRWQYILKLHGIPYSFLHAYLMYVCGLGLGIVSPGRIGDFIKVSYLKADRYSLVKAVFSSVLDRILDRAFLFLCGLLSFVWIGQLISFRISSGWLLVLSVLLVGLGALILTKRVGGKILNKIIKKLVPEKYQGNLKQDLVQLKTEFINYKPKTHFKLIMLTMSGWLLYFLVIYMLSRSIGLTIPFIQVVIFFVISTLITFVPITVAGVGTRDMALIILFSQFGYVKEQAISFSMLILIVYFFTILFGSIAWVIKPIHKSNSQ